MIYMTDNDYKNIAMVIGYWHTGTISCLDCRVKQRLARLALEWVTVLDMIYYNLLALNPSRAHIMSLQ